MFFFKSILVIVIFFTVISAAEASGVKILTKAAEEALELAAKQSGRLLSVKTKNALGRQMLKMTAKYGDDIIPLVGRGGLEVLEQGAKHGDDFWKLCKAVPEASRNLALHADELIPLAKRIGPELLHLEVRVPGLAARFAAEFGDDAVKYVVRGHSQDVPRLLGYASKADSPATKRLLFETYRRSADPAGFLKALDWKKVMAAGLSSAAVISAFKVSDGIREGIMKDPAAAMQAAETAFAPFRYALYALFAILLAPLAVKGLGRSIAAWKKTKE